MPETDEPGGQQIPAEQGQPAPGQMPAMDPLVQGMGEPAPAVPGTMAGMPDPMAQPAAPMEYSTDPVAPAANPMPPSAAPLPPATEMLPGVPDAMAEPVAPIASPDEDWVPPEPVVNTPSPQAQPVSAADVRGQPLPRINIQAFCEDQNTANILNQASQDRRLSKTHVSVQMGGMEAAAHYYRNAPTPNLILIESMHKRDAMVMDVDRLASVCDAGTKVIVIGHINDVLLYRELISRGVSEYLVMPLNVSQLMESLSNLYNDPSTDPLGNVIAFVGAKGGAGASTICHNTAWAISQGILSDVVIADLDLPFGTAGLDFNQDPVQGIADALLSPERLDEVLLDRLLSRCSDYLSLFAAPGTLDRSYDLSSGACDSVMDVLRKNVPYIAVDVPHLWTEWAQSVLVQSDRVVIVASPDLANLRNTKNLIEKLTAARPNDLAPFLVLNQVGLPKRPEISVKDFSSAVDTEPNAVIEFDSQLFGTATNNGQMIEEVSPKAKSAEVFRELARTLTDRTEVKVESKSLLAPILGKLKLKRSGK
jgi:pilus assembly protein CpaE